MLIFLDSRDHIVLAEKWASTERDGFEQNLRKKSGKLVFSMHNIIECCAPLLQNGIQTNVMNTLNRLEVMPHIYIADAKIQALELAEATKALLENREYQAINPFVPRFDYVVSPFKIPPSSNYIKYGLSEMIFELWREAPDLFEGYPDHFKKLKGILISNRELPYYRNHRDNFPNTIDLNLALHNIPFPKEKISKLANWIWDEPTRCPSVRLGYEVFHKILRNLTDGGEMSDIPDLANVNCIPYVDAATLDNRMRGYIGQADHNIGTSYAMNLYKNINEIRTLFN